MYVTCSFYCFWNHGAQQTIPFYTIRIDFDVVFVNFSGFKRRGHSSKQRGTSSSSSSSRKQSLEEEWSVDSVKHKFIEFFESKKYDYLEPHPVIPQYDQAIMFPNDGMNPIFSAEANSTKRSGKACNLLNVLRTRARGKHNLSDIGKNTHQHTYFQTLGMWQFESHYFKEDAIKWAWELLTKVYHLEEDRIYVTYFKGDVKKDKINQLFSDQENRLVLLPSDGRTRDTWDALLPSPHVVALGAKDNFWEMAQIGPCGPCTRIFYAKGHGKPFTNTEDSDFVEIGNLVFIEYNRESNGMLTKLPSDHVDMGMGLERLTAVLQGKLSNYDTGIFKPIMEAIRVVTEARPYSGKIGPDDFGCVDMAYRVIADHIRGVCFAIAAGTDPGHHSLSGHVLEKILDRAVSYGREFLGAREGFLVKLVSNLIPKVYPELANDLGRIKEKVCEAEKQVYRISLDQIPEAVELFHYLNGFRREQLIYELFDEFSLPKPNFTHHLRCTLSGILRKSATTEQLPYLVRVFTSILRSFFASDITSPLPLEFQYFVDFLDENCCNTLCMINSVKHPILLNKEERIIYRSEVQLICENVSYSEGLRLFIRKTLEYVIHNRNGFHLWTKTLNQRHPPHDLEMGQSAKDEDCFQRTFQPSYNLKGDMEAYTDDPMSFVRFCRNRNIHKFAQWLRDTIEGELTIFWPGFLSLLHEAISLCGCHINQRMARNE